MKQNRYINREMSLFEFHRRVLENAFDSRHPIFARLMFLSIASNNLDEFFSMDYSAILTNIRAGKTVDYQGYNPNEISQEILKRTDEFSDQINKGAVEILKALEGENVFVKKVSQLNPTELSFLNEHFQSHIKPFLTPTILDSTHPLPRIPNGSLTLIYKLIASKEVLTHYMVLVLTPYVKRLIKVSQDPVTYVLIEDVIKHYSEELIPINCTIDDSCLFKLIRNNNISIEEDIKNMTLNPGGIARKRRGGEIVKMFTLDKISPLMEKFLIYTLGVEPHNIIKVKNYLAVESFYSLISSDRKDLSYHSFVSRYPNRIRDFDWDYFRAISEKDILMHHPFENFEVFLGFLHQAAIDPEVALIKQTLYRTTSDSQVVKELITAAENGKQVVVLVELRASMDEENNIYLAKKLEESGIQVIYGNLIMKTHAKLCLVVKKTSSGKIQEFLHIGTGNYHPVNARMYTDFSLFTCNSQLCREANDVFNYITGAIVPPRSSELYVSPLTLKESLLHHIKQEIKNKRAGKPAGIWMKCNGLTDRDIIEALYAASNAGVKCQLIIRGICCLRPGVKGLSHNIMVKSVVGMYLEHSRMYAFAMGEDMPSLGNMVFISSADLMTRNLDYRIEVMAEIINPTVKAQLIQEIFANYLKDTDNSWIMQPDGSYLQLIKEQNGSKAVQSFDAHKYFETHESMSGQSTRF